MTNCPHLTGDQQESARKAFFYFNDDGQLVAARVGNLKMNFCKQRTEGTAAVWRDPFTC